MECHNMYANIRKRMHHGASLLILTYHHKHSPERHPAEDIPRGRKSSTYYDNNVDATLFGKNVGMHHGASV